MKPRLEAEEVKEANDLLMAILKEKIAARAEGARMSKEDIDEINAYCNLNKNIRENAKFALAKTLAAPQLARIVEDAKPRLPSASDKEWNGAAPRNGVESRGTRTPKRSRIATPQKEA